MPANITTATVNRPDARVTVNGVGESGMDMTTMPADVRVMQWRNGAGVEEVANVAGEHVANRPIASLAAYSTIFAYYDMRMSAPPTPEEMAAAAALAAEKAARAADIAALVGDAKVQAFRTLTPGQVRAWVNSNVATLADARDALGTLAVVVLALARGYTK